MAVEAMAARGGSMRGGRRGKPGGGATRTHTEASTSAPVQQASQGSRIQSVQVHQWFKLHQGLEYNNLQETIFQEEGQGENQDHLR